MMGEFDDRYRRRIRMMIDALQVPPAIHAAFTDADTEPVVELVSPLFDIRRERIERCARILHRQFKPGGSYTRYDDEPQSTRDWLESVAEGILGLYESGTYSPPNTFIRRRT